MYDVIEPNYNNRKSKRKKTEKEHRNYWFHIVPTTTTKVRKNGKWPLFKFQPLMESNFFHIPNLNIEPLYIPDTISDPPPNFTVITNFTMPFNLG